MEYSKGNWTIKNEAKPDVYYNTWYVPIWSDDDKIIQRATGSTKAEAEDNAKLIAAAPDMLVALENLENDDNSIPDTIWKMVQGAIMKARGITDVEFEENEP